MALVTHSKIRNRIYHRRFDHDEAQKLRAEGWTWAELARHFGVTTNAIQRVCLPHVREKMNVHTKKYLRDTRQPCKGGCGKLVWTNVKSRSGYCSHCVAQLKFSADVRDDALRCTQCREWKPDSDFPTHHPSQVRRGRSPECRACSTARRWKHRHAHPEQERETNARVRDKRREKHMARYVVLEPNGNGYVEVDRVDAGSAAHAIEKIAQKEGEYIAVSEGQFKLMRVAPVRAFRVVGE